MKVLLITGKLAEERVKAIAEKYGVDVYTFNVDVASFITPGQIVSELKGKIEGYDAIIVPGTLGGNLSIIEEGLGVKALRGTKDLSLLEFLLQHLDSLELSSKEAADDLLREYIVKAALEEIKSLETPEVKERLLKKKGNFLIGSLGVGKDFPMRIVAEIVDAEKLGRKELVERAEYYIKSGADIVDIGIRERNPEAVEEAIAALKPLGVPISIDTMDSKNIEAALDAGVDLILSFSRELIEELQGVKVASVIVPIVEGRLPERAEDRVKFLEDNLTLAREAGFSRVIGDPILNHPNFNLVEAISTYRLFALRNPDEALLFGAGNVTELLDADSVGVNALLASIAGELGAELLFTTEASDKTLGCVKELSQASKMIFLAKRRKSAPKDLGIDLLVLKEKRIFREPLDEEVLKAVIVKAEKGHTYIEDRKGYFKIFVKDRIYAAHFRGDKVDIVISGKNARDINHTICKLGLISEPSHGLYLGRELQKAEFALKYNKSYLQD